MQIDRDYLTSTLADLVRINSVNPGLSGGSTDEREMAEYVAAALDDIGLEVSKREAEPGRVSVVGRLHGSGNGPSLILYAHMDTVGVEGMEDPFSAIIRDGKLYGRGAYDMKGGLAASLTAVKALVNEDAPRAGDVLVTAVADEEVASIGIEDVLSHYSADAAVVTEPTQLEVCLAHKGFLWIEVETLGRAAHGSRFQLGVDANIRMGRFLAQLDDLEQKLRASTPHPLVGPPSLHAAVLQGGTGPSTYAAKCRLEIERRTIPGETEDQVLDEIQTIVDRLAKDDPTFQATVKPLLTRHPFEASPSSTIVQMVTQAARDVLGREPVHSGQTPWMDASFISQKGIETVVFGPAGAGAHGAEEWVDIESVVQLSEILARTAVAYCGRGD